MLSTLARTSRLQASRSSSRAAFSTLRPLRQQPTYQPPTPSEPENPHRAFYKSFGRPIAKVFLMALFTYQVLHYAWLRLEAMEEKEEKTTELQGLEAQLRDMTKSTKKA